MSATIHGEDPAGASSSTAPEQGSQRQQPRILHILDHLPSQDEYDATEKRLVRKVDFRLMPVLIAMIVLKFVIALNCRVFTY